MWSGHSVGTLDFCLTLSSIPRWLITLGWRNGPHFPCTLFLTELKSELAISRTTNIYRRILIVNLDFKKFSSLWQLLKWLKCLNLAVESLFPTFWWCWGLNTFPHVWERQAKAAMLNDNTTLSWAWPVGSSSQSVPTCTTSSNPFKCAREHRIWRRGSPRLNLSSHYTLAWIVGHLFRMICSHLENT